MLIASRNRLSLQSLCTKPLDACNYCSCVLEALQIFQCACTEMRSAQGFHTGGIPTALLGVGKGVIGLALRPTFGILEMTSKASYGMGLVCLGRCATLVPSG